MAIDKVGDNCCGCRNCLYGCPHQAITFETDSNGFEHPLVDFTKCVECSLCERLCPELNDCKASDDHLWSGSAYANSDEVKLQGSSGGIFGTIARYIISRGGIVYGAAFDDNLQLKTTHAETVEELKPLYKSKYLLCDTDNQFKGIKRELDSGRDVLYCASPCQIAALRLFLRKEYSNLLLVEFVCHGVGSQTLFNESIEIEEKKRGIKILDFSFRHKFKTASSHYYYYYYMQAGVKKNRKGLYMFFPYYNAYCKQLVCRDSCYKCKFATPERCADITIGDFHCINKYIADIDRFAGVSMFVCNTEKGKKIMELLSNRMKIIEFPWATIEKNNRFSSGNNIPAESRQFFDHYRQGGLKLATKKHLRPMRNWKELIYYNLPQFIRKSLIRFVH